MQHCVCFVYLLLCTGEVQEEEVEEGELALFESAEQRAAAVEAAREAAAAAVEKAARARGMLPYFQHKY
jgi:hypothetical protein